MYVFVWSWNLNSEAIWSVDGLSRHKKEQQALRYLRAFDATFCI